MITPHGIQPRVHTDFAAAFTPDSRFLSQSGREIPASVRAGGDLDFEGGLIAFGYLFDPLRMKTFARPVPAGRYPVELSVSAEDEPAAARIRLSNAQAVHWTPALSEGEDLEDLAPGEFFGTYVGNVAVGAFLDAKRLPALAAADLDPSEEPSAWSSDCFVRCMTLAVDQTLAVFSTGGPGRYAAYWGLTEHDELAEFVVDLNGFLENDYVKFAFDVSGATPRPVPQLRGRDGDVRIIERAARLVIEVTKSSNFELSLRGLTQKTADARIVRYEFEPDVMSVEAVAHFGLKRMALIGA